MRPKGPHRPFGKPHKAKRPALTAKASNEKPVIWYTKWMNDLDTQVIFDHFHRDGHSAKLAFSNAARAFSPVSDSLAPEFLYFSNRTKIKTSCRDAFQIKDGILICSPAFHDLLMRFDIGSSRLYEVPIYRDENKTPSGIPPHYVLRVTEGKPGCFVPEESTNVFQYKRHDAEFPEPDANWRNGYGHDQLAVRASAAQGVDLWYDPKLRYRLFLSDRLVTAIEEDGLKSRAFRFFRAKTV